MGGKRVIPWIEWGKWDSAATAEDAIHKQRKLNKRRAANKIARKKRKINAKNK